MSNNSKEVEFPLKQEIHQNSNDQQEKEKASSSSLNSLSSTQWPRLKDPRIVRVSRAFGGKDRHSKVCTIRGLRDRRIRLSVPTAIQLYDLQDRSKFQLRSNNIHWDGSSSSHESKEVSREMVMEKGNYWMNNRSTTQEEVNVNTKQGSNNVEVPSAIALPNSNNLLQRPNHPSFLGLLNTMPFGSSYNWGVSSNDHAFANQEVVSAITSLPPMLSLSTGNSSQMLFGTSQSYFSSNVNAMEMEHHQQHQHQQHQRQINNHYHQMLSSSSSQNPLNNSLNNPSFSLAKFLENSSNKEQGFSPK
ncbi:unnamed protein product [Vicia faba]|uniref:TCP domain-containing protein n=1 Tax=Vicia faba TaxID=3906 RepID=A0AAV0Z0E3_VICFA|nr:unnamed protein product [Vicia faba]